ncbi:MAG: hypothetical protein WC470_00990 [Candidatus Paceibacterota bacterium]
MPNGYSLKNLEKFLEDHPNLFKDRTNSSILETFKAQTERGCVSTGRVKSSLGEHFPLFLKEAGTLPEHIQIGTDSYMSRT